MTPSGTGTGAKRTTKPQPPKPEERWQLWDDGKGQEWFASHRLYRYRFMFANGDTADVIAPWDTSDLRGAVLKYRRGGADDRIVGVSEPVPVGWTARANDKPG
jgi:hypothetical protein